MADTMDIDIDLGLIDDGPDNLYDAPTTDIIVSIQHGAFPVLRKLTYLQTARPGF
jgi:hypothetical protein